MRFADLRTLASASLLLAACGGGGSMADMTRPADLTPPPPPDLQLRLDLAVPPMGPNVVPMVVDGFGAIDVPYVSVTICAPGTTTCTTVDHITVDTGSTGTRIIAEALPADFLAAFPRITPATGECYVYGSGWVFGSVLKADLKFGEETAANTSFELIGDPQLANVPANCQTSGNADQTVATFLSNGIIGVGHFAPDCGPQCDNPNYLAQTNPIYYDCTNTASCKPKVMPVADQVPNPVTNFPVDNNGVILELPATPETGLAVANGYLLFGIGTQDNNALGDAEVYKLNSSLTGWFMDAYYKNESFPIGAFFDSGSSAYFFSDTSIPSCQDGQDCPASTLELQAAIVDFAQVSHTMHFRITNADAVTSANHTASDGWAYTNFPYGKGEDFDVGLPYFFGHRMFSAFAGVPNPLGKDPFYAVY